MDMFEFWYAPAEALKQLKGNTSNGLYVIKLENKDAFKTYNPEFYDEYVLRGQPDIIYIGKACRRGGIRARLRNELLQKGRGTFFRSVGAVLQFNPIHSVINQVNYTFAAEEKDAIISFMEINFRVSYEAIQSQDELKVRERMLIQALSPIFNLQNNPNPSSIVKAERDRCRNFARGRERVEGDGLASEVMCHGRVL